MRILLITDNHNEHAGGAEHYFFSLKKKLKNLPDLDVFSIGFGEKCRRGQDYCLLKASKNKLSQLVWRLFINPIVVKRLRQEIKTINPDVIHLHNLKQYPLSVLQAIRGYKCIHTAHDFSLICPTAQNIHRNHQVCQQGFNETCWHDHHIKFPLPVYLFVMCSYLRIKKQIKKNIKLIIAPSPFLEKYFQQQGFATAFIPPFIHEKQFSLNNWVANEFLFVGNLGLHKGTDILLNEFALALKVNPQLRLNIVGDGPDSSRMKKQGAKLGILQHIRFLGWQEKVSDFYSKNIATIFPSIGLESFGLVITESMLSARAVVATNRGPSTWLLGENERGVLFDPLKKGDLAQQILRLAANPNIALAYGLKAQKWVKETFKDELSLNQLLALYSQVVDCKV